MAKQLYDYWFVQFDFPDENGKPYKSSGGKMVWNEKLKREIPEGWEVASLNRELEIKSGYAFKSKSYSSEGRFKLVTIKNVQDGYLDISTCECIETLPKDIKKWCILQKGDRLISLTGNCGRVCRVTSEALLLNQRVGVFCSNELFSEYFFQFLASNEGNRYCVNLANGAAQANLSPIDLCKMELIYPLRETLSLFNKIVQPIIQQYIANEQKIENLTKLRDSLLPLLMNGQVSINYDLASIISQLHDVKKANFTNHRVRQVTKFVYICRERLVLPQEMRLFLDKSGRVSDKSRHVSQKTPLVFSPRRPCPPAPS